MAADTDRILDKLSEQFMQPEVWQDDVWEISANHGETHYVPCSVCPDGLGLADYVEGTIDTDDDDLNLVERRNNVWCARLSAPGYMDQTDLSVFNTEDEAREYLAETYGDDLDLDLDDDDEPQEEDITTSDYRTFYYCGKAIVVIDTDDSWEAAVGAWCKAHGYFPNVWAISDHGNACLISVAADGRYLSGFAE
jgi:hypothetical protein